MRAKPIRSVRSKTESKIAIERGSGNVFKDLGLPEPEAALTRAQLSIQIEQIVRRRGLTQVQAARLMGVQQPTVSDIMRGHLAGYSTDRLFRFLNALGHDVKIVVSERPGRAPLVGRVRVVQARPRPRASASRT
ncbi:MAG: helix-turn-helix transcriptional regulator [Candidatus Eisenbacteria bacterium]